jgi:hypothetical protein
MDSVTGSTAVWLPLLVILIFGSVAGGLAWLLLGRPERASLRR